MGIIRDDFTKKYWGYYKMLEDECFDLSAYVEFDEDNFDVYSSKITRLFLSVCSEFDHVCRYICNFGDKENTSITKYAKVLLDKKTPILDISSTCVFMGINKSLMFLPFDGWKMECASKSLFWWENYTDLKHNRGANNKKGNLKSLLYSMAALYSLEQYAYKIIADKEASFDKKPIFDIPPDKLRLFISSVKTKFSLAGPDLYMETVDE